MKTKHDDTAALILTPLVTFSGLRRVPLLALSHNSLFPQLVIDATAVTVRVIRRHRFIYGELARIHAERGLRHRITLEPRTGWRTFTIGFASLAQARQAIDALAAYGAPLDPSLQETLARGTGPETS